MTSNSTSKQKYQTLHPCRDEEESFYEGPVVAVAGRPHDEDESEEGDDEETVSFCMFGIPATIRVIPLEHSISGHDDSFSTMGESQLLPCTGIKSSTTSLARKAESCAFSVDLESDSAPSRPALKLSSDELCVQGCAPPAPPRRQISKGHSWAEHELRVSVLPSLLQSSNNPNLIEDMPPFKPARRGSLSLSFGEANVPVRQNEMAQAA